MQSTTKPIIDPRYLSDSDGIDRAAMMEGLRVCAKIADAPPLKDLLGSMLRPLGATEICEETLESALAHMLAKGVSALAVTNGGGPLGVIRVADIVRRQR